MGTWPYTMIAVCLSDKDLSQLSHFVLVALQCKSVYIFLTCACLICNVVARFNATREWVEPVKSLRGRIRAVQLLFFADMISKVVIICTHVINYISKWEIFSVN